MARLKFKRGHSDTISHVGVQDGQVLLDIDKGELYTDFGENTRIKITDTTKADKDDTYTKDEIDEKIEEIEERSDVTDVVDNYEDLEQYDTSKLTNEDIIKVLVDRTHEGATSYYRWLKNTEEWYFIGSQGPYATKRQGEKADSALQGVEPIEPLYSPGMDEHRIELRLKKDNSLSKDGSVQFGVNESGELTGQVDISGKQDNIAEIQTDTIIFDDKKVHFPQVPTTGVSPENPDDLTTKYYVDGVVNPILKYISYSISNNTVTITGYHTSMSGSYEIPMMINNDPVTSIGNGAFNGCTSLKSITIPNTVTSIGNSAFSGCSSLTSITIPNSVTSIGPQVFTDCTNLTNITIPDSVTSIGGRAFDGCTGLTNIAMSDNVTSIGDEAFNGCTSLTSITIPASVISIGAHAFYQCDSIQTIYYGGTETQWNALSNRPSVIPGGHIYYNQKLATKQDITWNEF